MRIKDILKFKTLMRVLGYDKKIKQALFKSDGGGISVETDPLSLHRDQTTPQTVENGTPVFKGGSTIGSSTNNINIDSDGLMTMTGTAGIVVPHLMQSDSTDQAIADTASAQLVTFDTDVHHAGITRTSSSRFTITKPGSYLITFSGVCVGATGQTIQVWLRTSTGGGTATDVTNSNTIYPFKTTGVNGVVAVSFIQHFVVGDYFEFWTWGSAVTSTWKATAAGSTPTRPACPSIIITANYVGKD